MGHFVLLCTDLTLLLGDTRYGECNVNLHKTFQKNTRQFGKNDPYTSAEEGNLGKKVNWNLVTYFNTFAASYLNTQGLNNSCLKSPASTLVDLTFQSRTLRSFSLNQLCNLSL